MCVGYYPKRISELCHVIDNEKFLRRIYISLRDYVIENSDGEAMQTRTPAGRAMADIVELLSDIDNPWILDQIHQYIIHMAKEGGEG